MGGWYYVTKVIRGVPYRYAQTSWREGKRVRTTCRCLGRADSFGTRPATEAPSQPSALAGNTTAVVDSRPLPAIERNPYAHSAAVVRGECEPNALSSVANNLVVVEILDAARRSVATGRRVVLAGD